MLYHFSAFSWTAELKFSLRMRRYCSRTAGSARSLNMPVEMAVPNQNSWLSWVTLTVAPGLVWTTMVPMRYLRMAASCALVSGNALHGVAARSSMQNSANDVVLTRPSSPLSPAGALTV